MFFLPIDDGAVVLVVAFAVAPVVADLLCQRLVVQLNSQTRPRWHVHEALIQYEGLFQIALTQGAMFLTKKVGNRRGQLNAGCQRDRAERIVWSDRGVI